jgi:glutathione-regulated potassium-efflux system protein KefB
MRGNAQTPEPEPYIRPRKKGEAGNEEAADAIEQDAT